LGDGLKLTFNLFFPPPLTLPVENSEEDDESVLESCLDIFAFG
jgi:hypothetical protein